MDVATGEVLAISNLAVADSGGLQRNQELCGFRPKRTRINLQDVFHDCGNGRWVGTPE